jgi:AraC family transcriptional regulator
MRIAHRISCVNLSRDNLLGRQRAPVLNFVQSDVALTLASVNLSPRQNPSRAELFHHCSIYRGSIVGMNKLAQLVGPTRLIERTERASGGPIDFDLLKRKSWPGIAAEHVRIAGPAEYDFRLDVTSNVLTLLDLHRLDGETEIVGGARLHKKNLRHRLSFVPAASGVRGWSRIAKPATFTALYFDPTLTEQHGCGVAQIPPLVEVEDNMLRTTMLQFQAILNDPDLDRPGYAETLAMLVAFEISRLRSQTAAEAKPVSGLAAWQVRLVTDHLEGHIGDKTTIADLAALLDLSRFHFIRAFKKAVGIPPHQYMLRRRVERGRELLADRDLTITEIADRTGFGGIAQFTRAFRQIVGTTPTSYRREVR